MKEAKENNFEDYPKAVFTSSEDEDFFKSGGIIEENELDKTALEDAQVLVNSETLPDKTLGENLKDGFKIMGFGMIAVFGVLTILYIIIKIMGQFVGKNNEKN